MAVSEVFLTHIGGVESVTGSCTLLTIKRGKDIKRILIDFGSYQEQRNLSKNYIIPSEINPLEIDAVILTHVHADHAGLLARLAKHGFNGKLYVSQDTSQLLGEQLEDCSKILNENIFRVKRILAKVSKRQVRKSKNYEKFSYKRKEMNAIDELAEYQNGIDFSKSADITFEDISQILSCIKTIPYGNDIQLFPGVTLKFTFNNHILGSAIADIIIDRGAGIPPTIIEATGDLGRGGLKDDPHMLYEELKIPDIPKSNLVLITEATYGNRNHKQTMQEAQEELLKEIIETLKQNGRVIIPAFAVERTQLILYILNKAKNERQDEIGKVLRSVPITIDSPRAVRITSIYSDLWNKKRFSKTEQNYFSLLGINCASTYDEHIAALNNNESGIILTTGGMGDVGRILDYYDRDLEKNNSKILFCGYVPEDSLGKKVINAKPEEIITIKNSSYKIKAKVKKIEGLSSHADQRGLIAYIKSRIKGLQGIIVMHGDEEAKEMFADKIDEEGILPRKFIPINDEVYGSSCYKINPNGKIEAISFPEFNAYLRANTSKERVR